MVPREVAEIAAGVGFDGVREITLSSGETAYVLEASEGEKVGLPIYVYYDGDLPVLSDYERSMALLREPEYVNGGEE